MLTIAELTAAREKLCAAQILVSDVRDLFKGGYDAGAARLLNECVLAIGDEITALSKKIAESPEGETNAR